ncbi:MAG: hypothetical protein ABIP17_09055 [Ilumatobacteraceae bacterium]
MLAINWGDGLQNAWNDTVRFIPQLLLFLVILLVGYLIVKVIARVADELLERLGFDRAIERSGFRQRLKGSNVEPSDIVSKIIFWALFLLVLQVAFGVFGDNPVSDMLNDVIAYLPNILVAVIILIIAFAIAAAVREVIDASIGGLSYGTAVANGAAVAISIVGVFAALDQLRIAPAIVQGLFYAALAIIVGVTVVAVGGGGIRPMQSRWENALGKMDTEAERIRSESKGAKERIAERADQQLGTDVSADTETF